LGSFRPVQDFEIADSAWLKAIFLVNFLTALGSAIGVMTLLLRRSSFAVPLGVFAVFVPIVYYITHASLRYRHPIDPVVALLTALAIMRASPPRAAYSKPS